MFSYDALVEGVIKGDESVVESEVNKALSAEVEARDILSKGLISGMSLVGKSFGAGEIFLPELLISAIAMRRGLDIVKPLFDKTDQKVIGRVVIGTVKGDIHDIGKRIVGFLLEGNGYEVIDLGVDIEADRFAQAIEDYKPDILALSALLTTTIPNMGSTIDFIQEKGLREKIKIIVGGAPVNEEFAKSIGADGYAPEASSAVELVKKLIEV